jgi:predicted ATP-grasp superfamily ATP-dependent carboligase
VQKTATAFVLDMGPTGLGIARALGREGIPVVGMDNDSYATGLKSRYCKPVVTFDPSKEPKEALKILLNEGKKLPQAGILYPASDAFVLLVSRFRKELSEYFRLALPSEEIIEATINKRKLYELAERVGIPHPETQYPDSMQDVEAIKDQFEYPVFIKPHYSHIWSQKYKNKGFKVTNSEELVEKFRAIFEAKLDAMVQSIVIGPASNLFQVHAYFSEKHEPLVTYVARKLRQYPNEFGVGTYRETIHNEELLHLGIKLLREIRYRGPGYVEFKKDERDGQYKMIELNTRYGTGVILLACAGVNIPLVQYMDLTGEPPLKPIDYKDGVKSLDATIDVFAFCELNRKGELPLLTWLKSILNVDCHAHFAWDDMRPFLIEYVVDCFRFFRKMRHKTNW